MKKIILICLGLSSLLFACRKNSDQLIKPDIALDTSDRRTLRVVFYDEITNQPLPDLPVQFVDQWAEYSPPTPFGGQTDQHGVFQRRSFFSKNLLVSAGFGSIGSPYFLNRAKLQWRQQEPLGGRGYFVPEGMLTFFASTPVGDSLDFVVYVPKSADISMELVQDSAYRSVFNYGNILLNTYVYAKDSSGRNTELVWEQSWNVTDSLPGSRKYISFRSYAGRRHTVLWYLTDNEIVSNYDDDDGYYRLIRKGEIQLPALPYQQPSSLTIHF